MHKTSASFGQTISYSEGTVILSEVISALTFALDLTENAVPGHSLRTCLLGMRLAEAIGLPADDLTDLYYALLLKDIGCADHVTRLSRIMGDGERGPGTLNGWAGDLVSNPLLLERVWREVLPGVPLPSDIGRLAGLEARLGIDGTGVAENEEHRGAETMRHLSMSEGSIHAVAYINERWDGTGTPAGLRGEAIPRLARICAVAQTLDAFATEHGAETALRMLRTRRGTWFDPELVRAAQILHTTGRLWPQCQARDVEATRAEVLRLDPGVSTPLTSDRVDRICEAFGNVVDAKSPFTYHHSLGVTEVAVSIATELQLPHERISLVRRAAFLHDIGKLAVPNRILDKRGRLDAREWAIITRHPRISGSILERVSAFRELASLAAEHHERLDGSGYPLGLKADQLSLESRVIAMADCYSAMAENRPYRPGLDPRDILLEIGRDVPAKFDPVCFDALQVSVLRWNASMPLALGRRDVRSDAGGDSRLPALSLTA
ncbi:MAG TPA: HD domain-containing phosphohydrolase [Acidobacteriaceae bacterium]|nr:HD domain-containing phosphohydrolase [Acidobacteriaceae bacterium]